MKTPPLLVGAALLFWGWQADFLIVSAVLAVTLESARFIKPRWELSNEDFGRIWTFCTLLFLGSAVYAFTASEGPANVRGLFANSGFAVQSTAGSISSKTAVLMIRWLPIAFFLFIAAQTFSNREGIPLETISLILRRRWKKAAQSGQPMPASRSVEVAYPYFIACLFAASSHPSASHTFFWGFCGLVAWALWSRRSRRFGLGVWGSSLGLAMLMGYGGQRGLVQMQRMVEQYNPDWLSNFTHQGFDPLESRTEIGQVERIKTSSRIVIRLETQNNNAPPIYLREAGYRTYKSAAWYAGSSKEDFAEVFEEPANSGKWPLIRGKSNEATLSIGCYLPGGKGLLPLPAASGQLEQLPAFSVQKNNVGAVRAEGPGLVIFNALYGTGANIDSLPDTNEDLMVPDKEKPALDDTISALHLEGQSPEKKLESISRYFGTKFSYSLWQEQPKVKDTNGTALGWFLTKTHSGHCEYFATATVLLLRELGIPARYTVGYAVHEGSGRKYVVRQNDAHAWCRVWDDRKKHWEDFDTTPGTWMEMEQKQRSSFQFLADGWERMTFEFSKFRWGQSHLRHYIPWVLVPVLGFLLYQIIFRSGRRRLCPKSAAGAEDAVWPGLDSDFYQLEREIVKRGVIRRSSETLSDWMRRATNEPGFATISESLGQILRLHYRYRFDPQGLSTDDREKLRREVARCLSTMALEK